MRLSIDTMLDYELTAPADLLLAVEVAQMPDQTLVTDKMIVQGVDALTPVVAEEGLGRRTWTHGTGRVTVRYQAQVDVDRPKPSLAGLNADDKRELPALVVPYLFPSRYCEADRFVSMVDREFGGLSGGDQIEAIAAWIRQHLDYVPGVSNSATTAADTFIARQGVCRDFAHLMIAMTRAAGTPARMVAAYAWQLEPQDFHAVMEVWLEGRWHLVDATNLAPCEGIVRICVGRDATDISFLTVFGEARLIEQRVDVRQIG
ncbi:transglutaminase-like domain-containing protein [Sphingosinicella soli]|uniref:Transglutaminase-like putative cysteine protease n=1 Tax=Sphingosinicella soli TaxID=333708 RepID=A0A7W7B370_9SPHN|nr:transglutaminase family protein [Sphingosinicella soli]MBB4633192.1 transglutaminase-like putative cysteine protease [Sphingosinicella soli]